MMDVISARGVGLEMDSRLDAVHATIRHRLTNTEEEVHWGDVKATLELIEYDILSGDFGGYYDAYRRPLLSRVDTLLETIGAPVPDRPDYVYTQSRLSFYEQEYADGRNLLRIPAYVMAHFQTNRENKENKDTINSFPLFKRSANTRGIENDTCAICLQVFTVSDDNTKTFLVCSHRYHEKCIMQWIHSNHSNCPVCKHNVHFAL